MTTPEGPPDRTPAQPPTDRPAWGDGPAGGWGEKTRDAAAETRMWGESAPAEPPAPTASSPDGPTRVDVPAPTAGPPAADGETAMIDRGAAPAAPLDWPPYGPSVGSAQPGPAAAAQGGPVRTGDETRAQQPGPGAPGPGAPGPGAQWPNAHGWGASGSPDQGPPGQWAPAPGQAPGYAPAPGAQPGVWGPTDSTRQWSPDPQAPAWAQQQPPGGGWSGQQPGPGQGPSGPGPNQPGQWGPGGQGYPPLPQPSARPQRSRTPLLLGGIGVLVVAVVLFLGFVAPGFFLSTVFDRAGLESGVAQVLTDSYRYTGVADVVCGDPTRGPIPVRSGDTFTCTAVIDGAPATIGVRITSDSGDYEVSRPDV